MFKILQWLLIALRIQFSFLNLTFKDAQLAPTLPISLIISSEELGVPHTCFHLSTFAFC